MRELLIEGGRGHRYVIPGGAWWDHVELWKAEQAQDSEKVANLKAKGQNSLDKILEGFAKGDVTKDFRVPV